MLSVTSLGYDVETGAGMAGTVWCSILMQVPTPVLANTDLEAVRHLDDQEGNGSLACRLQNRAQDAHGALVVPVVEDEPEHVRVAVPALRDGACVAAAVVLGSRRSCGHPTA